MHKYYDDLINKKRSKSELGREYETNHASVNNVMKEYEKEQLKKVERIEKKTEKVKISTEKKERQKRQNVVKDNSEQNNIILTWALNVFETEFKLIAKNEMYKESRKLKSNNLTEKRRKFLDLPQNIKDEENSKARDLFKSGSIVKYISEKIK